MDENLQKQNVADTGRILLEKKLVARTWGNISARVDGEHFAISPSGLGYEDMQADDVPVYNMTSGEYEGSRKPSSEKKIHAACYAQFSEVNFVIHTHQDYATALGLSDESKIALTPEEKEILGEIKIAGYGLPGTGKLCANVAKALEAGSKTILMIHHGALVLGTDRDDAIMKAELLETICKREVESKIAKINLSAGVKTASIEETAELITAVKGAFSNAVLDEDAKMKYIASKGGFKAQTDDMAQMLGGELKSVEPKLEAVLEVLSKQDAVLVKNVGLIIKAEEDSDVEALSLLINKAVIAKLYTISIEKKINLSSLDCSLMRFVYKQKYSKKKNK